MAQQTKHGLGRGFESLLPADFDASVLLSPQDRIQNIKVSSLSPNPSQPRKHFDEQALSELAASIKQYGVVQPLLATPDKGSKYIIVAGERRWRAAKLAGLDSVPVVVHKRKELEQLEIALIENVQREDLSPLEQAISIQRLHEQFNFSYEQIAKRLGKASSTVTNIARLLNLPDAAKNALVKKDITEGHARQILALAGKPDKQNDLLKSIIRYNWNVRQAEQFVTGLKEGFVETHRARSRTTTQTTETKQLSKTLGTNVSLRRMAHGGKLEITYKDDNDLKRIVGHFKS